MAVLTAFVFGSFARMLRLPSLVGYLVAGLLIGPFTPGFVGDATPPASWPRSASSS